MATAKTRNIITSHNEALFLPDERVTVQVLKFGKTPGFPRKEADLEGRAFIWLLFPPTKQYPRGLSGNVIPWDEVGSYLMTVVVASESEAASQLADEIAKTAIDSIRDQTLGDDLDVTTIIGSDLAYGWAGSASGKSFSIEFGTQDVA